MAVYKKIKTNTTHINLGYPVWIMIKRKTCDELSPAAVPNAKEKHSEQNPLSA